METIMKGVVLKAVYVKYLNWSLYPYFVCVYITPNVKILTIKFISGKPFNL